MIFVQTSILPSMVLALAVVPVVVSDIFAAMVCRDRTAIRA